MGLRKHPLVSGQVYHVFNRGINKQPIFLSRYEYHRAVEILRYYRYNDLPLKYSRFRELSKDQRKHIWQNLEQTDDKIVELIAYCYMPNHYHLILRQLKDSGISRLIANFQNSYCRYFNIRNDRLGTIFQGQFKAVRVEDDDQLLHLSRYIHLNPYTSYVVRDLKLLEKYPWSSFKEYLKPRLSDLCNGAIIREKFKSSSDYRSFVFDLAEYQRERERIKHLMIDG